MAQMISQQKVERLYRRVGPAIYARCQRMLKDPAAAEDASQEVFLRALRHIEGLADETQALRWLYRVSTNYCLNVIRDKKPQLDIEKVPLADKRDNPEQALLDRDVVRWLLSRLPQKLCAPAMLYFFDDMEQQKVAEVLGITRRTVINRLQEFNRRSLKLLKRKDINL